MKIKIEQLKEALYLSCRIKTYYHMESGSILFIRTGSIFDVYKSIKPQDVVEISLPHFSMAYPRQCFFHAAFPDASEREKLCEKYEINDFPMTVLSDSSIENVESRYVQRLHWLFEDYHKEYNDFHIYRDVVAAANAILWCVEQGYDYSEDDSI